MDIGGMYWRYEVESPALIIEDPMGSCANPVTNNTKVSSVFGLLAFALRTAQTPIGTTSSGILGSPLPAVGAPLYILENGRIRMSEQGVNVGMTFVSDSRGAFLPDYVAGNVTYAARTARFYDVALHISANYFSGEFQVVDMDVNFQVQASQNYLIGTSQYPYFAIDGYKCSGSVTFLLTPIQFEAFLTATSGVGFMPGQTSGVLGAVKSSTAYRAKQFEIKIGNSSNWDVIRFGRAYVANNLTRSMSAGSLTTATVNFEAFLNSSTPVTDEDRRP
ncbi:MAG: hypothetical protein JSS66_05385 [Armatimonadetes bacterium]|nr:hypothetical protein [Armatimonadota bacterium]